MYEPEKNVFDWNNGEMQVLYKIMGWCEANHADVFLQQMWAHVAWNTLPGVHPLISIPKSLDDYAEGIATLLQHLTQTKMEEVILNDWTQWAHRHIKPFFLTEFGNMNLGWEGSNPGPKSFATSLSNASDVVCGLNIGVDGFNRWSFVNRGDLDGQWQLVRTYDIEKKCYTKDVTPEKCAYCGFAMLSRFLGKYASMLAWKTDYCIDGVKPTVFRNRDGNLHFLLDC